ncbi:MAG TPA: hypothetical protein VH186_36200 [Chloroflexia bacterium]|nr:hypothetical protein [Chloroflexia bacterium]
MTRTRKFIAGLVMGLVALALGAGVAITALGQSTAKAADTTTSTPAPTTTTPAASAKKNEKAQLRDAFVKNFAAQLNVDENKLNSAYTNAVGSTVDQAVKDGKLTQAQADKINKAAQNGFKGGAFALNGKNGRPKAKQRAANFTKPALDAAAQAIGTTSSDLKAQLKAGKSIADVAKSKNVDLTKVKDAMLASIKTSLDQAVKNGKLTQQQADKAYQAATKRIDNVVNRVHQPKNK